MENLPQTENNASPERLLQAVAANHRELFLLNALARQGQIRETDGITYVYNGAGLDATVVFPTPSDEMAGNALDKILAWYRTVSPKNIGCWSLDPTQPTDLGVRLMARGFQPGWRPCWMALDLQRMQTAHYKPETLAVLADNSDLSDKTKGLPYSGDDGAMSSHLRRVYPELSQQFIATLKGKIVGHCALFFNPNDPEIAGLYNVGVLPAARKQGVGKALVLAAGRFARKNGYRYIVLNATGKRMYEQVGFQHFGDGHTWWINDPGSFASIPAPWQISLAEAVGRGDIETLSSLKKNITSSLLLRPIPNGMTPLQLAIHCGQRGSGEWLVENGVSYSVLEAWDLGWKDRAAALLRVSPARVNELYGEGQMTLLHLAADRNDIDLANLALSAHADPKIRDKIYKSTPLDWARYFHRDELVRLYTSYSR